MYEDFKKNNDQFIKTIKAGLRVCQEGSYVDINYVGQECKAEMSLNVYQGLVETIKSLMLLSVKAWGQSVAMYYEDASEVNIHIKLTYNGEDNFTLVNTLDADDILNNLNFDNE